MAPWSVMRCWFAPDGEGEERTVIAKWLRDDPSGFRIDPAQVRTELAALEFLEAIEFPYAPRAIAHDLGAATLILEDLAPRKSLADLLRQRGAAALTEELLAFARIAGALNAATAGKADAYERLRARYGAFDPLADRARGFGPTWPDLQRTLSGYGLPSSAAVETEIALALETLARPGPFLAFSNGDPEANNFLVEGSDGRLIDFEFAGFRHALTCATWIHVPGPAWISVGGAIRADLETAYRRALCVGIAEAEDDRQFGLGLAAACLALAFDRLGRLPTLDQRARGDNSRVQMISTLECAADVAQRHNSLRALAGWAARIAAWLRKRWPDADLDLNALAAYTPRA